MNSGKCSVGVSEKVWLLVVNSWFRLMLDNFVSVLMFRFGRNCVWVMLVCFNVVLIC